MRSREYVVVSIVLAILATGVAQAADPTGEYVHTESWQDGGQAKLTLTLHLMSGGSAKIVTAGEGALRASGPALRQRGEILSYVLDYAQRRVVHEGTWSARGDRITVNLQQIGRGPGEFRRRVSTLAGTYYDDAIYIDQFDRALYGEETGMNFRRSGPGGGDSHIDTKDALVAGAVLVGLAALLDHHGNDTPTAPDNVRRNLESWLGRFATELETYDWRALNQSLTSDFKFHDVYGGALNRDQFVTRVRHRQVGIDEAEVKVTLNDLEADGNQATGVADVVTTGRVFYSDDRSHNLNVDEKVRMHWVHQGGTWVLQAARQLSVTQKIDGKVVHSSTGW